MSLWDRHPAVRTGDQLTLGEQAADAMKAALATWTALIGLLVVMAAWIATGALGSDPAPYFRLNLVLSCIAGVQCFVLLIAAKRADQIAAATALHTFDNTVALRQLLDENTALTRQVRKLTEQMHDHITNPRPVRPYGAPH